MSIFEVYDIFRRDYIIHKSQEEKIQKYKSQSVFYPAWGHALQETNFNAPAPEIVYALRTVERVNRLVRIRCPTGEKWRIFFFEKLFLEKMTPI